MYKFTIEYHYERFDRGGLKGTLKNTKRTAVVYAKDREQAVEKIKNLDDSFIRIADNGLLTEELQNISDSE